MPKVHSVFMGIAMLGLAACQLDVPEATAPERHDAPMAGQTSFRVAADPASLPDAGPLCSPCQMGATVWRS